MYNVILYTKLVALPENIKLVIDDFIGHLLSKVKKDKKIQYCLKQSLALQKADLEFMQILKSH